jgi:hypothetical protein
MISGRESSPRSHFWFTAEGAKTRKFIDPTRRGDEQRATIVEIRSTGSQTLVAPSIHPCGETYIWHEFAGPARTEFNILRLVVARLAACALLARHWQAGKRHEVTLALAGALFRSGWSLDEVERFIMAAAEVAGDAETADRRQAIRDTQERFEKREKTTGFRRFRELVPEQIADCIGKWLDVRSESVTGEEAKESEIRQKGRPSKATLLIELADETQLFHTPGQEAIARICTSTHFENWSLRSKSFRNWLARRFYETYRSAPGAQALQDALLVLESKAQYDAAEITLHLRTAERDGAIYLDLADDRWRTVEITRDGWRIVENHPVYFRRSPGMLPLPLPIAGGSINELRELINIGEEDDFKLLVAWLIGAIRPHGPYPVLVLHGEQGSAKSTTARLLRTLIDPNSAGLRCEPRNGHDLMIAAKNGWVISLDNLSNIPVWLSDALCRLSTGGAFATRELYTDTDEVLFEAQRPIILNGIEELATRGDLLDRSVIIDLPNIPAAKRRSEEAFWKEFETKRPRILGGLCDGLSAALRNLPTVRLERLPRMADFALWATASETALGFASGAFIAAYTRSCESANDLALESALVAPLVCAFTKDRGKWSGTASELMSALGAMAGEEAIRRKAWPQLPQTLSNTLRRLAPNLRAAGTMVSFNRGARKRNITLEYGSVSSSPSSLSSPISMPAGEPPEKHSNRE